MARYEGRNNYLRWIPHENAHENRSPWWGINDRNSVWNQATALSLWPPLPGEAGPAGDMELHLFWLIRMCLLNCISLRTGDHFPFSSSLWPPTTIRVRLSPPIFSWWSCWDNDQTSDCICSFSCRTKGTRLFIATFVQLGPQFVFLEWISSLHSNRLSSPLQ